VPDVVEKPVDVQIFGVRGSADTRKALRFFSERRIKSHFVDFHDRPPSPGELRRFVQKFGAAALVDRHTKRFATLGLARAVHPERWWEALLVDEPLIIRVPLVRWGNRLTVGHAEAEWRLWVGR
jgi:arsenate reductase-like glutaredoxin family protein